MAEIIKRDTNNRTIGAGVDTADTSAILMLRVDAVTNYLLVSVESTAANTGTASQVASRDGNQRTVCMGWDATNEVLQEILTDSNGYLLCDLG